METFFHRWFEQVWNQGRIEAVDEMLAAGCRVHRADEKGRGKDGPEEFKAFVQQMRNALSDIHATVDAEIQQGNQVAARFTFEATHTGDGLGFPPTNKRVKISGMCWGVLENGRAVEAWNNWDQLELLKQLNVVNLGE
jgi:steroid delta-isomerase-like uncharacterized protein